MTGAQDTLITKLLRTSMLVIMGGRGGDGEEVAGKEESKTKMAKYTHSLPYNLPKPHPLLLHNSGAVKIAFCSLLLTQDGLG